MATDMTPERFASNVLATLESRGLTVGWLARRIDMADSTLRFQLASPDAMKLRTGMAIARELGVTTEQLAEVAA